MPALVRWVLAAVIVLLIAGVPFALYRAQYAHAKRFREVTPGRFYRSGQMTAAGLRETIERYGIKTVLNLQHENPDPVMPENWLGRPAVAESEVCKQLNVRYVLLTPDVLPQPNDVTKKPLVVDDYLKLLDDPASYPILIHCKAGLHRTGRLTAIYRMEYEGWSVADAMRELRANGYGDRKAVLVVRQDLEDDSKQVVVALHGLGMIQLAQRPEKGALTKDREFRVGGRGRPQGNSPDSLVNDIAQRIGIEKRGNRFALYVSLEGETMTQYGPPIELELTEPFYVGIGFCSHQPHKVDAATISNVVLENTAGRVQG